MYEYAGFWKESGCSKDSVKTQTTIHFSSLFSSAIEYFYRRQERISPGTHLKFLVYCEQVKRICVCVKSLNLTVTEAELPEFNQHIIIRILSYIYLNDLLVHPYLLRSSGWKFTKSNHRKRVYFFEFSCSCIIS